MLAKIQYFPTYDPRSDISQPLLQTARFEAVSISRNANLTYFTIFDSLEAAESAYPGIDFSSYSDLIQDHFVVSDLYTDELLSKLLYTNYVTTDKSTKYIVDNGDGTSIATVTSEDGQTSATMRVFKNDLGNVATSPILYDCISLTNVNQINELTVDTRIYAPSTVEESGNAANTISVGSLHIPETYVTDVDIATVLSDIKSLTESVNSGTTVEYKGLSTDPDGDTLLDGIADATTLAALNYSIFDANETAILDDQFIYIKLTRNTVVVYYKIVKNQDFDAELLINRLKTDLSDSYVRLLFGDVVIKLDDIVTNQIIDIYRPEDRIELIDYLETNSIHYYLITSYYDDLVDVTETERLNTNTELSAYNNLFLDAGSYGFTSDDIANFGKVIAQMMYDVILPKVDMYPATVQYLLWIAEGNECLSTKPYITSNTTSDIVAQTKAAYLTEAASTTFLLDNYNDRQYQWILSRLSYASNQIEASKMVYETSLEQVEQMATMFVKLLSINNPTVYSSPAYLESFVTVFFDKLENLKYAENVVQSVSF